MKLCVDNNLSRCPRCGMENPLLRKVLIEFTLTKEHKATTVLTYHCNGCEDAPVPGGGPRLTGDFEIDVLDDEWELPTGVLDGSDSDST